MTDLIERLRREGQDAFNKKYSLGMWKLCADAADEIERLNRKLDQADTMVDRLQSQRADAEGELADYMKHCRCNEP